MSFLDYVPGANTLNGAANANGNESREYLEALNKLRPRQARFVKEYLICGEGAEAARRAGYTASDSKNRAYKLSKLPKVAAAIELGRGDIARNAQYDTNAAMKELDEAIAFAKSRDNAMAYAKCIELKAKLCGLMIDRLMVTETPSITGAIIDAKRRTLKLSADTEEIIDAETVQVFRPRAADPFGD